MRADGVQSSSARATWKSGSVHEIRIDDPADPRLDDYRGLTDTALRTRGDADGGLYIAESLKVIERAVAPAPPALRPDPGALAGRLRALRGCRRRSVRLPGRRGRGRGRVPRAPRRAGGHAPPSLPTLADVVRGSRTMVLEDLVEHQNVGSAFRAAAALGADAVLVSARCADPLYRRSVKVSTGTVFQVPWTRFDGWGELVPILRSEGIRLAALALRDDAVTLDAYAARRPNASHSRSDPRGPA
jgi:hypothetical protein